MTIMSENNFTVYVEQDEDGIFIGSIPSIPSCYAQGSTKQEMMKNLKEVVILKRSLLFFSKSLNYSSAPKIISSGIQKFL